jgi:hypothetical protein
MVVTWDGRYHPAAARPGPLRLRAHLPILNWNWLPRHQP